MRGQSVCASHGGKAPQARAAGERRLAEQAAAVELAKLGTIRRDVHPAEALLELVQWTAGEVDYWRARVAELDEGDLTWGVTKHEKGTDRGDRTNVKTREAVPHIAYRMLTEASDRLAKYAAAALRAGVEERRVQLAESQGALVGLAVRRILERLALSEAQQALVPTVVPEELRALSSAGGDR